MSETVTIEGLNHRGEGQATIGAQRVTVPYVLAGETVEIQREGNAPHASVKKIITPSDERIAPMCRHYGVCGGCITQHWKPDAARRWKRDIIIEALKRQGLEAHVADVRDAHGDGRRRAVFHARKDPQGKWSIGYAALRSHTIVPIEDCPILSAPLRAALPVVRALVPMLTRFQRSMDIHVTASDTGLDIDIRGIGPQAHNMSIELARAAEKLDLARLSLHGEVIAARRPVMVRVGAMRLDLPPASFLQATRLGEETLAKLMLEALGEAPKVADLFAGVGPFALRLLGKSAVHAVDSDGAAIATLVKAAKGESGLKALTTDVRDLMRRPVMPEDLAKFDAIVFDPPRVGAGAQAEAIARSGVPLVVAISCNPESFARDAKTLVNAGYTLGTITPVDQFVHSAHVELVASFTRTRIKPVAYNPTENINQRTHAASRPARAQQQKPAPQHKRRLNDKPAPDERPTGGQKPFWAKSKHPFVAREAQGQGKGQTKEQAKERTRPQQPERSQKRPEPTPTQPVALKVGGMRIVLPPEQKPPLDEAKKDKKPARTVTVEHRNRPTKGK